MIKSVKITNYLGETIKLELMSPELSGFVVEEIDGLGPIEANINTTDIVTSDGALFNSSRANTREIRLTLKILGGSSNGFNLDSSIEDNRQLTYKYFPIKKQIRLEVETDNRTAYIYGYVESNEPEIFSDFEETNITIICPNPYFISTKSQETVFSGQTPKFEFLVNEQFEKIPEEEGSDYSCLDNNSLTEKLIRIGTVEIKTYNHVPYEGDAECGVVITMHAVGTVRDIHIYNTVTREHMHIDTVKLEEKTGHPVIDKDDIIVNTIDGEKSVTLIRDGKAINILNCVDRDSDWFQLAKGDNLIAFTAEEGATNLKFKMSYNVLYEGV